MKIEERSYHDRSLTVEMDSFLCVEGGTWSKVPTELARMKWWPWGTQTLLAWVPKNKNRNRVRRCLVATPFEKIHLQCNFCEISVGGWLCTLQKAKQNKRTVVWLILAFWDLCYFLFTSDTRNITLPSFRIVPKIRNLFSITHSHWSLYMCIYLLYVYYVYLYTHK